MDISNWLSLSLHELTGVLHILTRLIHFVFEVRGLPIGIEIDQRGMGLHNGFIM